MPKKFHSSSADTLAFQVDGPPVPKLRAKVTYKGGYARAYTPEMVVVYEHQVGWRAKEALGLIGQPWPLDGYFNMTLWFHLPISPSWSKKRRAAALAGQERPSTGRSDGDNLEKLVLDALKGILWRNDTQVVACSWQKHYSLTPHTRILVKRGGATKLDAL